MATTLPAIPATANRSTATHHATAWDRTALTLLGGAGCALSYAALQQMAVAIHVREPLTYLFPLVIDGFIAYGVRALIVLRTAPFPARLYVWTLFGTATTASIWANALHAIRLNQQLPPDGLRLGDTTVGILSTLAPLALAGAVHLYILIARQTGPQSAHTTHIRDTHGQRDKDPGTSAEDQAPASEQAPWTPHPAPTADRAPDRRKGRPPGAEMDHLLTIARQAVAERGKISRSVVREAVRSAGLPLADKRLTQIMRTLRADQRDADQPQPATAP